MFDKLKHVVMLPDAIPSPSHFYDYFASAPYTITRGSRVQPHCSRARHYVEHRETAPRTLIHPGHQFESGRLPWQGCY